MQWEPILQHAAGQRAMNVVDAIYTKLCDQIPSENNPGLMIGVAGQLLFLDSYHSGYADMECQLDRMLRTIAGDCNMSGSLINGLPGIGLVCKMLSEKYAALDEDLFDSFYHFTRLFIAADVRNKNYDLLHGYLGGCYFLLQDEKSRENFDALKMAAEDLARQALMQAKGIGWSMAWEWEILHRRNRLELSSDALRGVNLGMSHGSPGVISVLTRMASRYPDLQLSELIGQALACLYHEEKTGIRGEKEYYYPSYSGSMGKIYDGQLAWCYSDLGICAMYFDMWDMTSDRSFWERASRIALSCAKKKVEDTKGLCSGLCHGAAGIAHIFNKIYQRTGDPLFKQTALYWYSVLLDQFLVGGGEDGYIQAFCIDKANGGRKLSRDNGFLEGLAGIGLSLQSALSGTAPLWDKLLFI